MQVTEKKETPHQRFVRLCDEINPEVLKLLRKEGITQETLYSIIHGQYDEDQMLKVLSRIEFHHQAVTHKRLIEKWNSSEYGVKTRVYENFLPQSGVSYILKTSNYSNQEKMEELIEQIEHYSQVVRDEVDSMNQKIKSI